MDAVIPVIIAGGTGSRLWPLSRALFPKQFHAIFDENSLLQNTLLRAAQATTNPPILVCNDEHRFLVAEQCRDVGIAWQSIVLEPEGRSTAPAIALAAHLALAERDDVQLLVLPADHLINDTEAFKVAAGKAAAASSQGFMVTFGIRPTHAETGYGYIELSEASDDVQDVRSFVEKPDLQTAQAYLASGTHLWNSGMFMLDAKTYLEELAEHCPEMANAVSAAVQSGTEDLDFFRPGDVFLESPTDSIDYAVMEKTARAKVVPVGFDWSDIGSWAAIWEASDQDADGNHFDGDVVPLATRNSYVLAQNRLVGTICVEDLVIVETADAVLVADKTRVQDVRALVQKLKACEREEYVSHREVFRPWGSYEGVGQGERYQVKRIKVTPGASLSLQKHHHRAEHWVVVRGTAEVTRGEETFTLGENESTYIPLGVKHRLRNPGKLTLELIEVQVGSYLGEDDIVRLDDVYGR
ncbi:MAG: mannose-1-phosphate guanylyltransferase/mannose-6-phosphate isomerase [Hyphomicrobium sp.]